MLPRQTRFLSLSYRNHCCNAVGTGSHPPALPVPAAEGERERDRTFTVVAVVVVVEPGALSTRRALTGLLVPLDCSPLLVKCACSAMMYVFTGCTAFVGPRVLRNEQRQRSDESPFFPCFFQFVVLLPFCPFTSTAACKQV